MPAAAAGARVGAAFLEVVAAPALLVLHENHDSLCLKTFDNNMQLT